MKANVRKTKRIFGDYELKHPLDCDCEILGKEFDIHLGNVVGKLLFPKLSPIFIDCRINGKLDTENKIIPGPICPIPGMTLGNEQEGLGKTKWGQTMSFPNGNSSVTCVMVEFSMFEDDLETDVQTVYDNIDAWFARFYDIYEVLSMYPVRRKEKEPPLFVQGYGFRNAGILLFTRHPTNYLYNKNDTGAFFDVDFLTGRLKYEELAKIIRFTNEQKELSFDYRCFVEGLRAFFEEDYKKAITVSSPALEAALLSGIKKFAVSKNIYFLDKLLKKYRMLGGYFALANDIDMVLPTSDYKKSLLDLRNDVVHNGYAPTKEETDKYLKDVKKYLDAFSESLLSC